MSDAHSLNAVPGEPAEVERRTVVRLSRDRRESDIENAAREVFCELGFEAASTAEIAARAGVAEGTLYKYFQNKRALLIKVLETWYRSLMQDFDLQLSCIQGIRNRVFYVVARHLRALKDGADLARLSYHEVRHSGDYYQSQIYVFNRQYTQVLMDICREGMDSGELRADLPLNVLRNIVFGGIDHLISGFLFNHRELDVEQAAGQIVALIFDGIGAPAEQAAARTDTVLHRLETLADRMEAVVSK